MCTTHLYSSSFHFCHRKKSPDHEGIIYMVLPQTWIKNWAEIGPQPEKDSDRSCDDHKSTSIHYTTTETLEGENEANAQQALLKGEQSASPECKEEEEKREDSEVFLPVDSDNSTLRLRSQSYDDILSNVRVISPTSTEAPSIPLLTVSLSNDQTSTTFVPMESGGSVPESEECEHLRNKVRDLRSTHSDSRLVLEGESVCDDGDRLRTESKNGSLKRSSSDTLINRSGESELVGRFTKFTKRFLEGIRSPGKPSKPGTFSQSSAETHQRNQAQSKTNSEANNDSDTSTSSQFRSQVTQKLLAVRQKFKGYSTSVPRFKVGVGWSKSSQTESTEDEVKKQEKRARSKSKILIV